MKLSQTKSGKLLQLAFAAHKRGETEIAKDIFVLAADEVDAPKIMGEEMPVAPNPEELKAKIAKALQEGDMDSAQSAMDELKACDMSGNWAAPAALEDVVPPAEAGEEMEEEMPAEGEDAELPPAQIATLVKIAKKIAAAGHKDLAEKITAALAK